MQAKYKVTKIELLAIVETLNEFKKCMVWGQQIKIYTDHKKFTRDALDLTSYTDGGYCWKNMPLR